jgi:hypothetical protein
VKLSSRRAVQLGVLFLAVRVLVDFATPLLPGAFRLDPKESVEVAAASYQVAVGAAIVPPPTIARRAPSTSRASSGSAVRQSAPRVARQLGTPIPRITHLMEPTASSPSPDDD